MYAVYPHYNNYESRLSRGTLAHESTTYNDEKWLKYQVTENSIPRTSSNIVRVATCELSLEVQAQRSSRSQRRSCHSRSVAAGGNRGAFLNSMMIIETNVSGDFTTMWSPLTLPHGFCPLNPHNVAGVSAGSALGVIAIYLARHSCQSQGFDHVFGNKFWAPGFTDVSDMSASMVHNS